MEAWRFILQPHLGSGRVVVVSRRRSGCAGFRYDVRRTDQAPEDHQIEGFVLDDGAAWLAIPKEDVPHLQGTQVQLERQGLNRVLTWTNPQEVSRCGCGLSVATTGAPE